MRTFAGGCHCEAVRFEVDALPTIDLDEQGRLRAVECNCDVCTKKGILHLIVPPARFRLLTKPDALSVYTFGTHKAQHRFCRACGMHPFYTPRSHPGHVDVNVRCLDDVDLAALALEPFDGRHWDDAIAGLNPAYREEP